ncbi:hypothetical protein [Stenotrophomonas sp. B1-1]|uniref:hypothetical protein n=1 Tax=Stenotrophomonas sp. B1-1 TaxID=2710648 RepID=UPI0013DC60BB|nr:hypothetical protein [Stenotrophomonas sp. B1-1]
MQMDIARIPSLRNHAQAIAEGDAVAIQTLRTQVDNAPITALFDSLCISHQQGSLILAMEELSNDDIQPLIEEARTNIFLRHGANPRNLANYVAQGISWTHPRNDRNVAIALEYTISQIPPEQLREDQNEGDYQVLLRVASTPRDGIEALTTHIEQLSDQDFQAVLRQCAVELLVWGEVQRSDAKNCVGITLALANEGGRLELKKLIEQPYRDPNVMLIG